jgi:hypothetical protein
MDLSSLFVLGEAFKRNAFRARPLEPNAELLLNLAMGKQQPGHAIRFGRESGKKLLDWVGTGLVSTRLISVRLASAWRTAGVTGWDTFPVELFDALEHEVEDDQIDGYAGLSVVGKSGAIDQGRHEVVIKPAAVGPALIKWARGLWFAIESWDGSDLFVPAESQMLIASAKAVEVLQAIRATNVTMTRLTEFERIIGVVGERQNQRLR